MPQKCLKSVSFLFGNFRVLQKVKLRYKKGLFFAHAAGRKTLQKCHISVDYAPVLREEEGQGWEGGPPSKSNGRAF
jgi:hypothetical protein